MAKYQPYTLRKLKKKKCSLKCKWKGQCKGRPRPAPRMATPSPALRRSARLRK